MEPSIVYLDAPIRNYAWGSHETIAGMMGRATPTPEPEAEIWYGAHPVAPSMVGRETGFVGLDNYIASDPRAMLGSRLLDEQGDQLPFLLKILAVERPLSIQAHPDKALARRGFMEETRRRVPLTAPQRIYRDPRPKPELVCALTPFDALVGFRPAAQLDLPEEVQGALGRLHADAEPVPFATIKATVEAELEAPLESLFARVESEVLPTRYSTRDRANLACQPRQSL